MLHALCITEAGHSAAALGLVPCTVPPSSPVPCRVCRRSAHCQRPHLEALAARAGAGCDLHDVRHVPAAVAVQHGQASGLGLVLRGRYDAGRELARGGRTGLSERGSSCSVWHTSHFLSQIEAGVIAVTKGVCMCMCMCTGEHAYVHVHWWHSGGGVLVSVRLLRHVVTVTMQLASKHVPRIEPHARLRAGKPTRWCAIVAPDRPGNAAAPGKRRGPPTHANA